MKKNPADTVKKFLDDIEDAKLYSKKSHPMVNQLIALCRELSSDVLTLSNCLGGKADESKWREFAKESLTRAAKIVGEK